MPEPDPTPGVFDLDAGRACLDFANTRSFTADHLTTYADVLAFAAQAKLLTPSTLDWLHTQAVRQPTAAAAAFQHARTLRDALRGLFLALAHSARPEDADLADFNASLGASLAHARLELDACLGAYVWGWTGAELDAPLWPIVRSAAHLLTSDQDRPLVRECGASDCRWLFLDATKNRSRQWCSMTSCGNREKARRHYQRIKADRTAHAGAASKTADAPRARPRAQRTLAAPPGASSATAG